MYLFHCLMSKSSEDYKHASSHDKEVGGYNVCQVD